MSNRFGQTRPRADDFQGQLLAKSGQLEAEKRGRKDAEDKYRSLSTKMDQVQLMLNKRNEELADERKARETAEKTCETLQMTINKLEEYLRKKHTSAETSLLAPTEISNEKPIVSDLSRLENELRKKKDEVEREKHYRMKAEQRCAELEEKLMLLTGEPIERMSMNSSSYSRQDSFDENDFKF